MTAKGAPTGDAASVARGLDAARLDLRQAGYCVFCNRIVVRGEDGSCDAGHPAEGIAGRIVLDDGDQPPTLPRFNLAAFLLPMIWGPAHGQWAGAVFLPLWLFADSIVRSAAGMGTAGRIAAAGAVAVTVAMAAWFARRADGLGWRRVCDRVSVEEWAARQRVWAVVSVPVAAALLGAAVYFNTVILPARGM